MGKAELTGLARAAETWRVREGTSNDTDIRGPRARGIGDDRSAPPGRGREGARTQARASADMRGPLVREGRARAGLAGWTRPTWAKIGFLFLLISNSFSFLFFLWNSNKIKPQFKFKYFKQVHQPKNKV
jgi:hypothetical protein